MIPSLPPIKVYDEVTYPNVCSKCVYWRPSLDLSIGACLKFTIHKDSEECFKATKKFFWCTDFQKQKQVLQTKTSVVCRNCGTKHYVDEQCSNKECVNDTTVSSSK